MQKMEWFGAVRGHSSHRQYHHSIERIRLPIRLQYLVPFLRYSLLFVESRRFWPTPPAFRALVGSDPGRISRRSLVSEYYRVHGLSCGVVYVILRLAVLVEHWLVTDGQTDRRTDRQTDTGPWLVPRRHSIARQKLSREIQSLKNSRWKSSLM